MNTLLKISWRNIWRNRTRSLVIIIAIILGLMGGVFSAGMRLGVETQQFRETVETQISHIQLHHPEFIANPEARFRLDNGFAMAQEIMALSWTKVASPRTVFDGMVTSANMNAGVRIKGIDPELEARTTGLHELIEEGTYFEDNGRLPSVIIGQRLARELRAETGSRIVLTFQDKKGDIVSASFRVEALYSVASPQFEERTVFVKSTVLNGLIEDSTNVTEIAVLIDNIDDYQAKTQMLREMYPEAEVRSWADLAPSLHYSIEFLHQNLAWMVGIIILGVSFGLLNTILMSVLERVNELGVLMAVGMKRLQVFLMVVTETTLLSVVGGTLGLILSYLMVILLNINGIDMSGAGGEGLAEFGYASIIFLEVPAKLYFDVGILLVAFAILASIYPAWKAVRFSPAEAVRME
ncbi:MAG: ABC transporter permease [Bacteroidetes bacterium]|nr:MAG: ABC transporter permease [Bacteroidota bacterium]